MYKIINQNFFRIVWIYGIKFLFTIFFPLKVLYQHNKDKQSYYQIFLFHPYCTSISKKNITLWLLLSALANRARKNKVAIKVKLFSYYCAPDLLIMLKDAEYYLGIDYIKNYLVVDSKTIYLSPYCEVIQIKLYTFSLIKINNTLLNNICKFTSGSLVAYEAALYTTGFNKDVIIDIDGLINISCMFNLFTSLCYRKIYIYLQTTNSVMLNEANESNLLKYFITIQRKLFYIILNNCIRTPVIVNTTEIKNKLINTSNLNHIEVIYPPVFTYNDTNYIVWSNRGNIGIGVVNFFIELTYKIQIDVLEDLAYSHNLKFPYQFHLCGEFNPRIGKSNCIKKMIDYANKKLKKCTIIVKQYTASNYTKLNIKDKLVKDSMITVYIHINIGNEELKKLYQQCKIGVYVASKHILNADIINMLYLGLYVLIISDQKVTNEELFSCLTPNEKKILSHIISLNETIDASNPIYIKYIGYYIPIIGSAIANILKKNIMIDEKLNRSTNLNRKLLQFRLFNYAEYGEEILNRWKILMQSNTI